MNKNAKNMLETGPKNAITQNYNEKQSEIIKENKNGEQRINSPNIQMNLVNRLEPLRTILIDNSGFLEMSSTQVNNAKQLFLQDPINKYRYQKDNKKSSKYQQKTGGNMFQNLKLGIPNQWYTLNNRMNQYGTTIEMIYTGKAVSQPQEPFKVQAIPGVTHVTMKLPAGVMPNIGTSMPDMPSLINAMNFLKCPERHPPDAGMGPATTIQIIPKINNNGNEKDIEIVDVIPISCERVAPLKRRTLNLAFQSYSLMQFTVDQQQPLEPGRVVFDADISPTYLLNTHQQLRLQAAIQQDNVSLVDALLPIVSDLYEEHDQLHSNGLQMLPAPMPMPYGTMQFHYDQSNSLFSPAPMPFFKSSVLSQPNLNLNFKKRNVWQSQYKKRSLANRPSGNQVFDVNSTVMALDSNGNYYPIVLSNWRKINRNNLNSDKLPLNLA